MRKILILLTALSICSAANVKAQDDAQATSNFKRFENNFYIGLGRFIDRYNEPYNQSKHFDTEKGLTIKLGYGLNFYFTEKFSLMGGLAYREDDIHAFEDEPEGADSDYFSFWDVPVVFQVHLSDPLIKKKASGCLAWVLCIRIAQVIAITTLTPTQTTRSTAKSKSRTTT